MAILNHEEIIAHNEKIEADIVKMKNKRDFENLEDLLLQTQERDNKDINIERDKELERITEDRKKKYIKSKLKMVMKIKFSADPVKNKIMKRSAIKILDRLDRGFLSKKKKPFAVKGLHVRDAGGEIPQSPLVSSLGKKFNLFENSTLPRYDIVNVVEYGTDKPNLTFEYLEKLKAKNLDYEKDMNEVLPLLYLALLLKEAYTKANPKTNIVMDGLDENEEAVMYLSASAQNIWSITKFSEFYTKDKNFNLIKTYNSGKTLLYLSEIMLSNVRKYGPVHLPCDVQMAKYWLFYATKLFTSLREMDDLRRAYTLYAAYLMDTDKVTLMS